MLHSKYPRLFSQFNVHPRLSLISHGNSKIYDPFNTLDVKKPQKGKTTTTTTSEHPLLFPIEHIRNFAIVAHVNHGKSTLADAMMAECQVVDKSRVGETNLDNSTSIERMKGITVNSSVCSMIYKNRYLFNLIDTPGHHEFSYEVERTLSICDGAILLVDALNGIQAQTLHHYHRLCKSNLKIIGVINKIDKIDLQSDILSTLSNEMIYDLFNLNISDYNCLREINHNDKFADSICTQSSALPHPYIHKVSAKSTLGISSLCESVCRNMPSPRISKAEVDRLKKIQYRSNGLGNVGFKSKIFNISKLPGIGKNKTPDYLNLKSIILIKVCSGQVSIGDTVIVKNINNSTKVFVEEVGIQSPHFITLPRLTTGMVGYILVDHSSLDHSFMFGEVCSVNEQDTIDTDNIFSKARMDSIPLVTIDTALEPFDTSVTPGSLNPDSNYNVYLYPFIKDKSLLKLPSNVSFNHIFNYLKESDHILKIDDFSTRGTTEIGRLLFSGKNAVFDPQVGSVIPGRIKARFRGKLHLSLFKSRLESEFGYSLVSLHYPTLIRAKSTSHPEIEIVLPEDWVKFKNKYKNYRNDFEFFEDIVLFKLLGRTNELDVVSDWLVDRVRDIEFTDIMNNDCHDRQSDKYRMDEIVFSLPLAEVNRLWTVNNEVTGNLVETVSILSKGFVSATYSQHSTKHLSHKDFNIVSIYINNDHFGIFDHLVINSKELESSTRVLLGKIAKELSREEFAIKVSARYGDQIRSFATETVTAAFRNPLNGHSIAGDASRKMKIMKEHREKLNTRKDSVGVLEIKSRALLSIIEA